MFNSTSMTGSGLVAFLLIVGLKYLGIVNVDDQVVKLVTDVIENGSFLLMIFGQVRRKDLKFGLIRK